MMKDAVALLLDQVAKGGVERSPGKVREEPALDPPSVFLNPFPIERSRKRPRLKIHRAWRQNRGIDNALDCRTLNSGVSICTNRPPVADCLHQLHLESSF